MTATQVGVQNLSAIVLFLIFIVMSVAIVWWATKKTKTADDFFVGGHRMGAAQNGIALVGDYVTATGFLGIVGFVSLAGFDGLINSVAGMMAWPIMLFLIAESMRNLGKFTFADAMAARLDSKVAYLLATVNSLIIVVFFLIAQMVGAGSLLKLMFGVPYEWSVVIVAVLMALYVTFGGMVATTLVQVIKAAVMVAICLLLMFLCLSLFKFDLGALLQAAAAKGGDKVLVPGVAFRNPWDAVSLALAVSLGLASLPQVLMRFYTVPDARAARASAFWATCIIGVFELTTFVLGYGAMVLVGGDAIRAVDRGGNMAVPLLAATLGGPALLSLVAAVAFLTILAAVAGILISGSATLAHDLWIGIIRKGEATDRERLNGARIATVLLCVVCVVFALLLKDQNVAILTGVANAVAASANFPILVLAIYWSRLTTTGAIWGSLAGLVSSLVLIYLSPLVQVGMLHNAAPIISLNFPAIFSVPLAFVVTIVVSLATFKPRDAELYERAQERMLLG